MPHTDFAMVRLWASGLQLGRGFLGQIANTYILNPEKESGPNSMDLGLGGSGRGGVDAVISGSAVT